MRLCGLLILVLGACGLGAAEKNEIVWEPAKTWVFALGVLQFENDKLGTWPDEGRVDAVMIDALKARGVPEDHIVFLKNAEATRKAAGEGLEAMLKKTAKGDAIWIYYAGHGSRDFSDPGRAVSFVCYDSTPKKPESYWAVADVVKTVAANFKGDQALFLSDCCHSGMLAEEVRKVEAKTGLAVLTSAHQGSRSTGNWTYTQVLVDMLNGNPMLDLDCDGGITFAESARYLEEEMAFAEGQLSCNFANEGFSRDTVMAKASGGLAFPVGARCEALDQRKVWCKAKILEAKDGKFFVTWPGWDRKWDCWVEAGKIRAWRPEVLERGTRVEVEWDGVWYKATVLQDRYGLHFIHYEGYPDADDEWVPPKRIRRAGKNK